MSAALSLICFTHHPSQLTSSRLERTTVMTRISSSAITGLWSDAFCVGGAAKVARHKPFMRKV